MPQRDTLTEADRSASLTRAWRRWLLCSPCDPGVAVCAQRLVAVCLPRYSHGLSPSRPGPANTRHSDSGIAFYERGRPGSRTAG